MKRRDYLLASLANARLEPGGGLLSPQDYLRTVGEFSANMGMRSMLAHVTPADWLHHFAANEDAFAAVVDELQRID